MKEFPPKTRNESVFASFSRKYIPWCHACFVKNDRLECEIIVSPGYFSILYRHDMYNLY